MILGWVSCCSVIYCVVKSTFFVLLSQFWSVQAEFGAGPFPQLSWDQCSVSILPLVGVLILLWLMLWWMFLIMLFWSLYSYTHQKFMYYQNSWNSQPLVLLYWHVEWIFFLTNWPSCVAYREHNVCDINPVHQLFATGTIEVGGTEDVNYVRSSN